MVSKIQKRISIIIVSLVLLAACSDRLDTRIERGLELVQQESYQQAIELLQEVLQDDPKNVDALILLQAAFSKTGDYEQSVVQGKNVLKINPNNQTAYHNLAYSYRRLERYEDAIRSYKSLLALSSENEGANELLGLTLAGRSRYDEAIEPLAKALRLKGEDAFLLQTLGICNLRLQRYNQAIDAFERIIKTKEIPELLAKARLNIGDVYYAMGDYGKAIEQYAMIALEQDQSTYRLAQHYIKALNRLPDDAKRKIIAGFPFPSQSYITKTQGNCGSATLKMTLNFLNDPISQKSVAKRIEDDTTPYALWNFAVERGFQAYLGIASISDIKYWINRGYPIIVLILDPKDGWGHFTLVVGYDDFKDVIISHDVNHWIEEWGIPTAEFQHAWNYYGRYSLFIFPSDIDLPHNFEANIYAQNCLQALKGEFLYYEKNSHRDAFMELETAILNQPPLPGTYAILAKLYANDPTKQARASQYISTALTMGSSNGYTLLQTGIFYLTRNEYTKAFSMFTKGLELYPNAYELRQKLASVYIKLRDHANAVIELEKLKIACDLTYCNDQKQINTDLLMSYMFLEDYGKAIEANQELIELSSTIKEKFQALKTHTALGILHKQPEIAKESLRQILALLPEDDPERQAGGDLLQAMDRPGTVVDVGLKKDLEGGRATYEFSIIKSNAFADSIAHKN